jgi:hypothetical protein
MTYLVTLTKLVTHTVTIRVEAIDRANAEAKAVGVGVRNGTFWDSVVESEPTVTSITESTDATPP